MTMNSPVLTRRALVARLLGASTLAGAAVALAAVESASAVDRVRSPDPSGHGNAVLHWNDVAAEAFAPSEGTNPMAQSRAFAILHAAIHDALNAIVQRYETYTRGFGASPQASADVAVAAAAREVLARLLPGQAPFVEAAYGRALATVRDGQARDAGIAVGRAAAAVTLSRRRGDRADAGGQPVYAPSPGPGEYQFTAPFDFAAQPGWGRVEPFVIDPREHALDGPLSLTGAEYASDLAYVADVGRADSRTRTPEQSTIAKFWYEDSPLGWNRIASTVVGQAGLDPWEAARTFTLVHFAMADGFIAGFHEKYRHRFWRPVTAIHAAAGDGNPLTRSDRAWQPFLVTPPVPDYPSTHTVLGWAAAEVLGSIFGDAVRFSTTSLTLPGATRSYSTFSQAAEENGLSRLYAGIHFRHAVNDGRRQGRSIGRAVAGALAPVH